MLIRNARGVVGHASSALAHSLAHLVDAHSQVDRRLRAVRIVIYGLSLNLLDELSVTVDVRLEADVVSTQLLQLGLLLFRDTLLIVPIEHLVVCIFFRMQVVRDVALLSGRGVAA